jgi:hypothetical protein
MPIPQSTPRGSPVTEVRQGLPAKIIATATVLPDGTVIRFPFTFSVIALDMGVFLQIAYWQIHLARNFRWLSFDQVSENAGRP